MNEVTALRVQVDRQVASRLKVIATERGLAVSATIREAIELLLELQRSQGIFRLLEMQHSRVVEGIGLTVRVEAETARRLRELANEYRCSLSTLLRSAIELVFILDDEAIEFHPSRGVRKEPAEDYVELVLHVTKSERNRLRALAAARQCEIDDLIHNAITLLLLLAGKPTVLTYLKGAASFMRQLRKDFGGAPEEMLRDVAEVIECLQPLPKEERQKRLLEAIEEALERRGRGPRY